MNTLEKEFVHQLKENQRIVHKMCRIYTNNQEDHEDLFQEITIQLWKAFPKFRREAKFSTWMYRIALNTAMTSTRKKKILTDSSFEISNFSLRNDDYHDDTDKLKSMYDAIHQLTDIEKALIMMFLDNKKYNEISKILGITEGNARVKMNRAKNNLKNLIQK